MSGSTNKKAIIQRFEREPRQGFVNPHTYLRSDGVELLSLQGTVVVIPYEEIKTVCFVKDFEAADPSRERRLFATRPKTEGLWIRMLFLDGDFLDGLLPNNLLGLEPQGFTVVPPDPSSNNQRVFVPKTALRELKVLGVVGSPLRRRKREAASKDQIGLFE